MVESIPVIGGIVAKLLCWPISVALTAPAETVVQGVKTACNFVFGASCAP